MRRFRPLLLATLFAVGVLAPSAGARIVAHAAEGGWHPISNDGTHRCLSTGGYGVGADVVMWQCNGSPNQTWEVVPNPAVQVGSWIVISQANHLCINNYQQRFANYNVQNMYPCDPNQIEQWYWFNADRNNGDFWIQTDSGTSPGGQTARGSGYCLTSNGWNYNGAVLEEYSCNNSDNQTWHN